MTQAGQADQTGDGLPFVVAEITTTWPKDWPVESRELVGTKFEAVIEHHRVNGYRLHSFQVSQVVPAPGKLTETIIAVFEKVSR